MRSLAQSGFIKIRVLSAEPVFNHFFENPTFLRDHKTPGSRSAIAAGGLGAGKAPPTRFSASPIMHGRYYKILSHVGQNLERLFPGGFL